MLRTRSRAALATLLLAVLAAATLATADVLGAAPAHEQVAVLLWLAGWVLLVWAAVLGVATTVGSVRAGRRADAALALLGLVCVVAVAVLHPLAGSGGGAA